MRASILALWFALFVCSAFFADTTASLKEASLVTEVFPWGETVTAIRLEYTDEVYCGEVAYIMPGLASDSRLSKYHVPSRKWAMGLVG